MEADLAKLERRAFVDTRQCRSVEFAVAPGVKLTVPACSLSVGSPMASSGSGSSSTMVAVPLAVVLVVLPYTSTVKEAPAPVAQPPATMRPEGA